MKEILFKAKRKDNGEWIEGLPFYSLCAGLKVIVSIVPFAEVPRGEDVGKKFCDTWGMKEIDEETLSPYIGIKDKNGNKIFEGDTVMCTFEDEEEEFPPEFLTVYYDDKAATFLCRSNCATHPVECDCLPQGEIVGNIHNKED